MLLVSADCVQGDVMATSQTSPLVRLTLLLLLTGHINAEGGSHFIIRLYTTAMSFLFNAMIRNSQASNTFVCECMVNSWYNYEC